MGSAQSHPTISAQAHRGARVARLLALLGATVLVLIVVATVIVLTIPPSPLPRLPSVTAAAVLALLPAYWTYTGLRAWATPQRVRVLWLRKFQSESGHRFRVSRVVDRLNRVGIAPITLQDRDVALSLEQRRNRVAGALVRILAPWVFLIIGLVLVSVLAALLTPEGRVDRDGLPVGAALYVRLLPLFAAGMMALVLIVAVVPLLLILAALGRIGNFLVRGRDDFPALPALLGKDLEKQRGAALLRIKDENWQSAVSACLGGVDVAIIDVSELSDAILWEVRQAINARGREGLVLIRSDSARIDAAALARVLGGPTEGADLIAYPADNRTDGRRFAAALSEGIFRAFVNTAEHPAVREIRAQREARANRRRARTRWIAGGAAALIVAGLAVAIPFQLANRASIERSATALQPVEGLWCNERGRPEVRFAVTAWSVQWFEPDSTSNSSANVIREDFIGPMRDGLPTASNVEGVVVYRLSERNLSIEGVFGGGDGYTRCPE